MVTTKIHPSAVITKIDRYGRLPFTSIDEFGVKKHAFVARLKMLAIILEHISCHYRNNLRTLCPKRLLDQFIQRFRIVIAMHLCELGNDTKNAAIWKKSVANFWKLDVDFSEWVNGSRLRLFFSDFTALNGAMIKSLRN